MDIMEARSRACLLLALTFDPKFRQGVALIPPHLSSLARLWSSMTSNASLMATGDASMMHGWGSLRVSACTLQLKQLWIMAVQRDIPGGKGGRLRDTIRKWQSVA